MNEFNGQKQIAIGLAGKGTNFDLILGLLLRKDFTTHFPWAGLAACAGIDPGPETAKRIKDAGIATYESILEMVEAVPDINTVFFLSEDQEQAKALRAELPERVSLVDAPSAMFLWEVLVSEKLCTNCRAGLAHTRAFLNAVIEEVKEDIILMDVRGNIVELNKNVYALLGRDKEDFIGLHRSELEDYELCRRSPDVCPFDVTLKTKNKAEGIFSKVDENGHMRYLRIYTYPVFNESGDLTHIMEMRRDITDRTRMEQRLQQSEKLAAIGELSTYIAHEIRNPLFAIGGFANSLLRSENVGDSEREKVGIILKESQRLDEILKSIINFTRPTKTAEGEVDVNQVIQETMSVMDLGCSPNGICMSFEPAEDVALVKGDSELVKQSLINLLKNAMEAMPGGGKILVTTGMNEFFVVVTVEDTGNGISEDIQDKVFNPFFSTKDQGAGLGLAMTKKIVDEMGGHVELASIPDKGTTVFLHLPPMIAADAAQTPTEQ